MKGSTPAVRDALFDANKVIGESHKVKAESIALIDELAKKQTMLRDTVNEYIVQKISQTVTLNVSHTLHVQYYNPICLINTKCTRTCTSFVYSNI